MNEKIFVEYNRLKELSNIASSDLSEFCKDKQNGIGLIPDEIWLHNHICLQLKKAFREADNSFKLFIINVISNYNTRYQSNECPW